MRFHNPEYQPPVTSYLKNELSLYIFIYLDEMLAIIVNCDHFSGDKVRLFNI